jgi:hypothetical protein
MPTLEIEEELTVTTGSEVLPGADMIDPPVHPDESELPESFPIPDVEPDPTTGGESLPQSFPIPEPEPDDTKG